jgi:hypothetical protein
MTAAWALHDNDFPDPEHHHQALGVIVKFFRPGFFFLHVDLTGIADCFFIFEGLHMDGLYRLANYVVVW